jgi:hypothetical protein
MVGRLVFVLCFFFFCGEVLCSCFQENAWMRLPHIAVNGMTNCDSLGAAISCHQLPSAAISHVSHHVFASASGGKSTLLLVLHLGDG